MNQIKLAGLSGTTNRRFTLIHGATFAQGDTAPIKVAGKHVKLRCLEIREHSVLIEIEGLDKPRSSPLPRARHDTQVPRL